MTESIRFVYGVKAKVPFYLIALGIILLALASIFIVQSILRGLSAPGQGGPIACTMEAKICPDGSAVGRTGPNCEFSPCPSPSTSNSCDAQPYSSCQSVPGCAVCPPCPMCNSVSCHTTAFCQSIGFGPEWYDQNANPDCKCPSGYVQEARTCNPQCYYSTPRCLQASVECTALPLRN